MYTSNIFRKAKIKHKRSERIASNRKLYYKKRFKDYDKRFSDINMENELYGFQDTIIDI